MKGFLLNRSYLYNLLKSDILNKTDYFDSEVKRKLTFLETIKNISLILSIALVFTFLYLELKIEVIEWEVLFLMMSVITVFIEKMIVSALNKNIKRVRDSIKVEHNHHDSNSIYNKASIIGHKIVAEYVKSKNNLLNRLEVDVMYEMLKDYKS